MSRNEKARKDTTPTNEYDNIRLMNIQANKEKMRSLNIKRICASMTSLVDSTNEKKRKNKQRSRALENEDYDPLFDEDNDHIGRERECDQELVVAVKKKQAVTKGGQNRSHFIPPLSLANVAKINNKQRQEVLSENGVRSVNFSLEKKKQAISRHQQNKYYDCDPEDNQDDIDLDDFSNEEFTRLMEANKYSGIERELAENYDTMDSINEDDSEMQEETTDKTLEVGAESNSRSHNAGEVQGQLNGENRMVLANSQSGSGTKRKRGDVYCRKLTALAPGEKICLEYDENGNPIGENASLFAFFLGEQIRNKAVCPIQVKDWTEYKPETLDHLWNCILEKFEFDNPDLRKEDVMRHARSLFRNSRHKLRRKYILEPKLKTKEAELKAKPKDMTISDWTYLVNLWRSKNFQDRSSKAKESRALNKMPHYSGSKSHARVKEEIKKRNGGECSRIDVLLETRKRKSKKDNVSVENLARNAKAIDEVNKLKKEREDGLNKKTDEQIFVDVLGKDTHGYLRCYGRGKTITQYYGVKPSRLDLVAKVLEVEKTSEVAVQEARKNVEEARKDAEEARKEAEEARRDAEEAKMEATMTRNEVDAKIEANNKVWEARLLEVLKAHGIGTSN